MHQVQVFFTVDTETSIGGAFAHPGLKPVGSRERIFGKFSGGTYGIPWMMQIAEKHAFRLTFFVETMHHLYFGHEAVQRVIEFILDRGHDAQLHLHPNYRHFASGSLASPLFSDFLHDYDAHEQFHMLCQGVEIFERSGAPRPRAFRAGCYGAGPLTLEALKRAGFWIDSSYNASFIGKTCFLPNLGINDTWRHDSGVYLLPVTNFIERSHGTTRLRPLDINGAGFEEIRASLRAAHENGMHSVVIVLHSFSFIKPYDVQYRKIRLRGPVVRRFEKLCEYVARHSDKYRARCMGDLSRDELEVMSRQARHVYPSVPFVCSMPRLVEQLWDRYR